jgi:hypothetical protein
MTGITWAEFKKLVESKGVKDYMVIGHIDVTLGANISVEIEDECIARIEDS